MSDVLRAATLLATFVLMTACDAGQTGEEFPLPCDEERRVVDWTDDSVGFSGQEVLDSLAAVQTTFTWPDGSTTSGTVLVALTAGVVERVERSPNETTDPEDCPDGLVVPMQLSLDTEDGAWVTGQAELLASANDTGSTWMEVPASSTAGLDVDPDATVAVRATWDAGVTSGVASASDLEGDPPLATWGPQAP